MTKSVLGGAGTERYLHIIPVSFEGGFGVLRRSVSCSEKRCLLGSVTGPDLPGSVLMALAGSIIQIDFCIGFPVQLGAKNMVQGKRMGELQNRGRDRRGKQGIKERMRYVYTPV